MQCRIVAKGDALLAPSVTRRLGRGVRAPPGAGARDLADLGPSTPREREVLGSSRGRSNAEIAEDLFVGEATVKTHVAHVLSKLQLRDRIQAVILAYELGIVRAHLR